VLYEMSAMRLVQLARREPAPAQERTATVLLLDRFEHVASVKIRGGDDVEYHHLARCNGQWVIVNVLWGLRQGAPGDADDAAIMRTAGDYRYGASTGDRVRLERSLHPALAKRTVGPIHSPSPVWPSPSWPPGDKLYHLSALGLVQPFRPANQPPAQPSGSPAAHKEGGTDVTMLDRLENGASVRVDFEDCVDYLHIARWNAQWLIINILWALRPSAKTS
jgi:hypothetical protein